MSRSFLVVCWALSCSHPCSESKRAPDPTLPATAAGKAESAPAAGQAVAKNHGLPLDRIRLPKGFRIAPYATGIANARSMVQAESGTLFVGTRKAGNVYAVPNADGDTVGDRVITIAKGLNSPNGVALKNGHLYVAEIGRILRFNNIEAGLKGLKPGKTLTPVVVTDRYPEEGHHGWKFIAFGPDEKLYVPVGAPCNICLSKDNQFASITRIDDNGANFEIVAHGVRNTVGFDWHPLTKELWFTDNGRDWLGDDSPPDELNRAKADGMHFGYPFCHAGEVRDPEFGRKRPCSDFEPPARKLGPHVAALGMRFYTGDMFPATYRNQIFIAEHGSWNRSKRIGYRIMFVTQKNSVAKDYLVFADGWQKDEEVWGRPVDVLVANDGALLISDDYANAIYRVSYQAP